MIKNWQSGIPHKPVRYSTDKTAKSVKKNAKVHLFFNKGALILKKHLKCRNLVQDPQNSRCKHKKACIIADFNGAIRHIA